ncbi:MAG: beta-ketoacyl-[acyl-carrier-protein] synthase family protein [Gemmatimonadota bacterium]
MSGAPRRVFITGMGVVSPHGHDPNTMFERVYAGESAVRGVEVEEAAWHPDLIPLAPADFDPAEVIPRSRRMLMSRAAQFAVVAAEQALEGAGLLQDGQGPADAGVFIGCSLGGSEAIEDAYRLLYGKGRRPRPMTVPLTMANAPTAHISMGLGMRGPTMTYSMACASSAAAIGEAFRAIRDGYADRILAGGAEAMLSGSTVATWHLLRVLATGHPDGFHASSRPFDAARTGMVLGEGAAVLMLENEEAAARRGVEPLGEIVGYGAASDAHKLTEPHGEGQVQAMRAALGDAGLKPEAVAYVNAHATGTPAGDVVEIAALKETFGDHARALQISSTKAVHGHLIGCAGALESLITVQALAKGRLPPTANLTDPDPLCDLDCIPLQGREAPDAEYAISNSFAFGGSNAVLVFRRAGGRV